MSKTPEQIGGREPFYQFLLLQTFRLVARLAIRLRRASLSELKELLGIALFRELRGKGYSIRDMSVALDCTARNVRYIGQRSRDLATTKSSDGCIRRVIRRLRQGPASMIDLKDLMPIADGFDPGASTVGLLLREQVIEDCIWKGLPGYQFTQAYQSLSEKAWSEPLKEFETQFSIAYILTDLLSSGLTKQIDLLNAQELQIYPRNTVMRALDLMVQMGELQIFKNKKYAFTKEATCLVPADPTSRLRIGAESMVEKLGMAFDTMISGTDPTQFGQRTFEFDAHPAALTGFIREHNNYVRQELIRIDQASEKHPEKQRCVATWFIFPRLESIGKK